MPLNKETTLIPLGKAWIDKEPTDFLAKKELIFLL